MNKHTQGPWAISRNCLYIVSDTKEVCSIQCGNTRATCAFDKSEDTTGFFSDFSAEQKANARLISAAPELLAACERSFNLLLDMTDGSPCVSDFDREIIEQLNQAIKKAKGEL